MKRKYTSRAATSRKWLSKVADGEKIPVCRCGRPMMTELEPGRLVCALGAARSGHDSVDKPVGDGTNE